MRSKRISRQEKEAQATQKKAEREEFERYYENIPTVEPYSFMLNPGESSRGRVSWCTVEEDVDGSRKATAQSELHQSELLVYPMLSRHR